MSRVLIVCGDRVGRSMAGPAIRCWEMAGVLARAGNQVRLTVPVASNLESHDFSIRVATERSMAEEEAWADVIVVQGFVLTRYPVLAWTQKRLVVDLYDPFPIETLEMHAGRPLEYQNAQFWPTLSTLLVQTRIGDLYLCASERQRDFWMGALLAANRLNPSTLAQDRTMRRLIDLAPFGISDEPPAHSGTPAIKGVLPGIGPEARVAIWAGGVYNWFDPLTLLRAWPGVVERIPQARLVFLGLRHPNPTNPEMEMGRRSLELAESLGLRDRTVYFNTSWVPYERRQDYLLESDLGVTTHFEHLETRLSFRTRVLDYIWAGLPIVATEGDSFAEWIERTGTGRVVRYQDREGIVDAVATLLGDPDQHARATDRIRAERPAFTWERALRPLIEYCADPWFAQDVAGHKNPSRTAGLVADVQPPPGLMRKVLWYREQEGTLALVRRAFRRAGRQVRRRSPG
jgi:glycosyltransferase involved in cell wall biosynthesis